jgi:hypothetical protein
VYRFAVSGVIAILLLHVDMLPNATNQQKEIPPTSTMNIAPLPRLANTESSARSR